MKNPFKSFLEWMDKNLTEQVSKRDFDKYARRLGFKDWADLIEKRYGIVKEAKP